MALNFPSSLVIDQIYTVGTSTWNSTSRNSNNGLISLTEPLTFADGTTQSTAGASIDEEISIAIALE